MRTALTCRALRAMPLLLAAPLWSGDTANLPAVGDRPIPLHCKADTAQALYRTQLLGELDHPVGEQLAIAGLTIPARLDAKGNLELDLKNDGKFKSFAQPATIALSVPLDGGKRTFKLSLFLSKRADKTWVYRNATQLSMQIGSETLVIVDVNGNGVYNEPGIDGMTWAGHEWLFPLPAADERWCTTLLDLTGLAIGPLGDDAKLSGRMLATTVPDALAVLKGVNGERIKLGLTPRPENPKLSAELQSHCHYMALNKRLTHPETSGDPGYTSAGNAAGMRSILSQGTAAENVAAMMVQTYFHRQDVIRPETLGFGVGYESSFGGIDGRTDVGKAHAEGWPVLCPVPDEREIQLSYQKETPDATPGDASAGYPITAYFGTSALKLSSYTLKPVAGSKSLEPVDCYPFDPQTGANASFTGYQRCVAIIPKDPLVGGVTYEVMLNVDVGGKPWTKTWQFSTIGAPKPK